MYFLQKSEEKSIIHPQSLSVKKTECMIIQKNKRISCVLHSMGQLIKEGNNPKYIAVLWITRQVTRATHVRNRVYPRVELILKIIIILLIIFLGFIKSKPC